MVIVGGVDDVIYMLICLLQEGMDNDDDDEEDAMDEDDNDKDAKEDGEVLVSFMFGKRIKW